MNAGQLTGLRRRNHPARRSRGPAPVGGLVAEAPAAGTLATPVARSAGTDILLSGTVAAAATAAAHAGEHDRVSLTVRIDRAMHARLRALAARQQRTHQDIVEGALDAYLNVFAAGCACSAKPKA